MCNLLTVNANCMSVVVFQYTVVFNVKTVTSVVLFRNFREIELTVSYKQCLILKNACTLQCLTTGGGVGNIRGS